MDRQIIAIGGGGFGRHPGVGIIEKYILQLPFSIEPASTPKWYAAVVLLKQIFEIGEFIDYVHKINFKNSLIMSKIHQTVIDRQVFR